MIKHKKISIFAIIITILSLFAVLFFSNKAKAFEINSTIFDTLKTNEALILDEQVNYINENFDINLHFVLDATQDEFSEFLKENQYDEKDVFFVLDENNHFNGFYSDNKTNLSNEITINNILSYEAMFTSLEQKIQAINIASESVLRRANGFSYEVAPFTTIKESFVSDEADLFTSVSSIDRNLKSLSEKNDLDLVIVTRDGLNGKDLVEFADDYFDYGGYGVGAEGNGVLMLIDMNSRNVWISTKGFAITSVNDYGIEYILDVVTPFLSDSDYDSAANAFANAVVTLNTLAKEGHIFSEADYNKREPLSLIFIPLCLGAGIVIALAITGSISAKMKSVRGKIHANDYIIGSSLYLTKQEDMFLYSNTTRVTKSSSSGGGRSGGSSHSSSSGSRHGGGGRGF